MEQLAIVARLKEGAEERARELIAGGPPFDPADAGLSHHTVYLSAGEVVFVFEGREVEWIVDDVITEPFQWSISDAFEVWRPFVEGEPRLARPCYSWHASSGPRAGSGSSAP